MLRLKYPQKVIIGYINLNSIRNKFENFSRMIGDKLDVLTVAETKLDSSFPNSQFRLKCFEPSIRLDISKSSRGLLVYIKENLLCKKIEDFGIPNDIQTIPIEINIGKQKWLLFPIYRSPSQDPRYFIENICAVIDRHTSLSENVLLIGDFNMGISDQEMIILTNTYNLFNLFKGPTCLKTPKGRSIDLMVTNRKQSFIKSFI